MPIGVADAGAIADAIAAAEGIVPCGNSSSSPARCIIDCITVSYIFLNSVEADGRALGHHSACQQVWPMPLLLPLPLLKELSPVEQFKFYREIHNRLHKPIMYRFG